MSPWMFYASFKSATSERAWLHTEAIINHKIRSRTLPTVDDASPLLFFDGATMHGYRFPSRGSETVYCRGSLRSDICELIEKSLLERSPSADFCRTLSQEVSSIGVYAMHMIHSHGPHPLSIFCDESLKGHNTLFLEPKLQSTLGPICDVTKKYFNGFDPASQRHPL
jgi:hypothetical protein